MLAVLIYYKLLKRFMFRLYALTGSKGKVCLLLFKGGSSLLIRRLSINVTLKSLFLEARMETLSKINE